mmetsp:Transcript_460/g.713  ORF Transcript_460/g.713 Transcript_460/m.713 type:complete len:284 (-) Transcript_460:78-929(-)|eukprot:CAMPEP_0201491932 /NCGR_PEP_ID=MMETSP0151_2-20130828/31847_1 /ASSEMBLY_ACC=CAM_ASM_000257 /TAXON_ID=200890 /ORGANISM="Paramoeba atlantica, Strain 621/1 / CCAP 1560/9" /LENGTH=283 /DNA_ID=CAMNT_0047878551 /DNA_START=129 /DNA_END=980 /DNA_ORIENTATION=+
MAGCKATLFKSGSQYALHRPTYPKPLYEDLAVYLNGKLGENLQKVTGADVASGTGQATHELGKVVGRVYGVDGSSSQVEACSSSSEKVSFRVGTAEDLPFANGELGLVAVAQALHWFDLPVFWREAERVLCSKGVLAVWTYSTPHLDHPAADAAFQSFHQWLHEEGYWDQKRKLVDSQYEGITFPFSHHEVKKYSMKRETGLRGFLNYVQTFSSVHTHLKKHPDQPSPVHRLAPNLIKALKGAEEVKEVDLSSQVEGGDPFGMYEDIPVTVSWPLTLFLSSKD